MLCLQQLEGRTYDPCQQPEKILLKPTVTRFGRSHEDADVVINSSISPLIISRIHAEIHFVEGKFRIDCKGLNGLLVNRKKRSSAVLCEGDEIVFGGAGVKTKEGRSVISYDSELVYVFKEVSPNNSEESNSLGEGTSDGRVLRRSKRKQPVSPSEELPALSGPPGKKNKSKERDRKSKEVTADHEKADQREKKDNKDERSKKCLADLNEELLCCICRELMVLAHTLPCSHTFCYGCIRDWLGQSRICPNCRAHAQFTSAVPVKVLDNTINKVAEEVLSPEQLEERQLKIQDMSEEVKDKKTVKVLTVPSDSDSDSDDIDFDDSDMDDIIDIAALFGGREQFHYDYHYSVEHARSGRAQCRTCYDLIPFRTLRWIVDFKTRWEHLPQTHYHHLECFLPPNYITYNYLAISPELTRTEKRLVKERLGER